MNLFNCTFLLRTLTLFTTTIITSFVIVACGGSGGNGHNSNSGGNSGGSSSSSLEKQSSNDVNNDKANNVTTNFNVNNSNSSANINTGIGTTTIPVATPTTQTTSATTSNTVANRNLCYNSNGDLTQITDDQIGLTTLSTDADKYRCFQAPKSDELAIYVYVPENLANTLTNCKATLTNSKNDKVNVTLSYITKTISQQGSRADASVVNPGEFAYTYLAYDSMADQNNPSDEEKSKINDFLGTLHKDDIVNVAATCTNSNGVTSPTTLNGNLVYGVVGITGNNACHNTNCALLQ